MISRRKLHPPGKGVLITQLAAVHKQKKSAFFALAQSELEDVDKISIRLNPDDKTKLDGISVSLLDTLPVANALNVSKFGMLFIPAEFGETNEMSETDYFKPMNATKTACHCHTNNVEEHKKPLHNGESCAHHNWYHCWRIGGK
eukprot:scaffold3353_cov298-Chaetoceros_neogracile.AAC.1